MPRRVKLPDGQVLNFPDDVTDQEISEFLDAQSTPDPAAPAAPMPSATQAHFGSHRPINEAGQPLEAPGFLDTYVNPALQSAAHPESLTDLVNLLIPGQIPPGALQAAAGVVRGGARTLGNLVVKGAALVGDVVSPDLVGVVSPRLGKGLELAQRLRAKVGTPPAPSAPPAPKPRAGSFEEFLSASPERRAEIRAAREDYFGRRKATASAAPPAAPSATPPAASAPGSAAPSPAPGIRLTPQESQALQDLVAQGYDEADVVQAIVQERQAGQPSVAPKASGKPSLTAAETKEYQRLMSRGKTPEQAMTIIEHQRAFVQTKGLPTSEQTRQSVVDRNTTGRWRD